MIMEGIVKMERRKKVTKSRFCHHTTSVSSVLFLLLAMSVLIVVV